MKMQRGFGTILAIVVLVILAALAAAIVSLATTQQASATQDLLSARAWLAARAGNDWGLYQALRRTGIWYWDPETFLPATPPCSTPQAQTLDLHADTGFWVSVSCSSQTFNEGESSPGVANKTTVYTIDAVACNSSARCPDPDLSTSPNYIERRRQVIATAAESN